MNNFAKVCNTELFPDGVPTATEVNPDMQDQKGTMTDVTHKTVAENGVKLDIPAAMKRSEQLKYYNPKLAGVRELVLATLKIEAENDTKPLLCLDAFAGAGLNGLQWKLHLGDRVHVVLAEETTLKSTCALNGMKHCDWLLDPSRRVGQWPAVECSKLEVHACPYKAAVVLHQEAFNFIFLQRLFTGIALQMDSVFCNLRHNGVVCFLTPSMASACFRSPQIIQRMYQAHTQKTEYVNEMAVRVFIADIARAAARYQKGIDILYTACVEDHFLVVVRATKNNQPAKNSVESCRQVLHCLMCEERVVCPQTHSPVEYPYTLLPCDCKEKQPGKTAVILGPLWVADIFNVSYIELLLTKVDTSSKDKCKLRTILQSLLEEAVCPSEGQRSDVCEGHRSDMCESQRSDMCEGQRSDMCEGQRSDVCEGQMQNVIENTTINDDQCRSCGDNEKGSEPMKKKSRIDNGTETPSVIQDSVNNTEEKLQNVQKCTQTDILKHRQKPSNMPLFYYDVQNKRYKISPKLDKLVIMLRTAGHRASRTHFDPQAVRTSANIVQLNELVLKQMDS